MEPATLAGAAALEALCRALARPRDGALALARDDDPDVALARGSLEALGGLEVGPPLLRALVQATGLGQARQWRDGGLLSLFVACRVVGAVAARHPPGLARARCVAGARAAADACDRLLATPAEARRRARRDGARGGGGGPAAGAAAPARLDCRPCDGPSALRPPSGPALSPDPGASLGVEIDWGDAGVLLGLARGVVAPKAGPFATAREVEGVAVAVVEGFVRCLGSGLATARVRVAAAPGAPVGASRLVRGALLPLHDSLFAPAGADGAGAGGGGGPGDRGNGVLAAARRRPGAPPPRAPVRGDLPAALLSAALDAAPATAAAAARHAPAASPLDLRDGGLDPLEAQLRLVEDVCAALVAGGARVVASQRTVHARAKAFLGRRGVVVMERLGSAHVGAFSQTAGARALPSLAAGLDAGLVAASLGRLGYVGEEWVGGRAFWRVEPRGAGAGDCPVATVVCCAPTEPVAGVVAAAAEAAVHVLGAAVEDPAVVAGGGAAEYDLARQLDGLRGGAGGAWAEGVGLFADALRAWGRALGPPGGPGAWDAAALDGLRLLEGGGAGGWAAGWQGWARAGDDPTPRAATTLRAVRAARGQGGPGGDPGGGSGGEEDGPGDTVLECVAVDLARAKASALTRAAEAAEFVLRARSQLL